MDVGFSNLGGSAGLDILEEIVASCRDKQDAWRLAQAGTIGSLVCYLCLGVIVANLILKLEHCQTGKILYLEDPVCHIRIPSKAVLGLIPYKISLREFPVSKPLLYVIGLMRQERFRLELKFAF